MSLGLLCRKLSVIKFHFIIPQFHQSFNGSTETLTGCPITPPVGLSCGLLADQHLARTTCRCGKTVILTSSSWERWNPGQADIRPLESPPSSRNCWALKANRQYSVRRRLFKMLRGLLQIKWFLMSHFLLPPACNRNRKPPFAEQMTFTEDWIRWIDFLNDSNYM